MLEMHFIYLWFKNRIDFWNVFYSTKKMSKTNLFVKNILHQVRENSRMNLLKFVLLDDDRIYCETIKKMIDCAKELINFM